MYSLNSIGIKKEYIKNRIKIDNKSGCWLWTGCTDSRGYGMILRKIDGKSFQIKAHRLSWAIYKGDTTQCVLHKCDVRLCVNPSHLFTGTKKDNAEDRHKKNRTAKGEEISSSKLTATDVFKIKDMLGTGCIQTDIAERFGILQAQVSRIKRGVAWKHL